MTAFISSLRIAAGLAFLAVATAVVAVVCVLLMPSRRLRIAACNLYGHVTGPFLMLVTGTKVSPDTQRRLKEVHPAIYVSNHTSIIDMFVAIWACPLFTCGVAKKEIIFYPFIGQLYLISGHLRVDRGNRHAAKAGMDQLASLVEKARLGIWIWPEGTRSKDGRLLPLKKGFAHLALATGLPVVPVVVKGAHRGWRKNSLIVEPSTVEIEVLPPISTKHWTLETLDEHIAHVHNAFHQALPQEQQGVPMLVPDQTPPPVKTSKTSTRHVDIQPAA